MVMIPSTHSPDGQFFDEAMAETFGTFEEQVLIRRFSSVSGGNAVDGQGPTKNYTDIQATALIESLSAQELAAATGFYIAGDIKAQFRQQVYGSEGGPNGGAGGDLQSAGRYSDLIVYRGRTYKIVGHPYRTHYGGQYYWDAVLRQSNAA